MSWDFKRQLLRIDEIDHFHSGCEFSFRLISRFVLILYDKSVYIVNYIINGFIQLIPS